MKARLSELRTKYYFKMKTEGKKTEKMDRAQDQLLPKDKNSSQLTDYYYERNLRVLQQIQEKRASLLGSRGQAGLSQIQSFEQGKHERLSEVSVELNSKSPDYSLPPPRYFTPVEGAQSNGNDVTHHLVKPTPRQVGVVRPVQYPDRKICHPVPQAMRRPRGSSTADTTGSCRLPIKKRPYIPNQEDVGPSSNKVGRMAAIIGYSERSAFYKYVPARVMDEYFRFLHHTETGMTTEDREVAENTNNNAVQNKFSSFNQDLSTGRVEDNAELDMEVAEIFNNKPELKMENCQSPKEPWIPQITDDRTAAVNRGNLEMNNSFIQQITPKILCLSPSTSHGSQTTPETANDNNFVQDISPVIVSPSPKHSHFHQSSFETFSEAISSNSSCTERNEENLVYLEPSADLPKPISTFPGSGADVPGKKKPSMEELRRMVLDKSTDRPGLDRFTQTEEEQFAEILEDFLEENKGLPPEIRDDILDMLTKTRETVAKQKESILYTAEIYKGESEDETHMYEFDRATDDEVIQLLNEIELPDHHTEQPDLPIAVTNESPKNTLLDMETNMEEFDRAADAEIMDLINEIDLSDLPAAVTSESPNDVFLDVGTNVRESMAEPTDGVVYSTNVFIGEDDERLLAEFERAVNSGILSEDTKIDKLPDPIGYQIEDPSRSKFESIRDVEVEMDSTGQAIYDEIAAFFGYDGYNDYLSYDYSAEEALLDLPFEHSADEEHSDLAIDDLSHEYSAAEDLPDHNTDYKVENGVLLFE